MKVELQNGERVEANYVRHLRTITPNNSMGGRSIDVDLYRLADGREIAAQSPEIDGRAVPVECSKPATAYGA
jgi:hypothetical protein